MLYFSHDHNNPTPSPGLLVLGNPLEFDLYKGNLSNYILSRNVVKLFSIVWLNPLPLFYAVKTGLIRVNYWLKPLTDEQ